MVDHTNQPTDCTLETILDLGSGFQLSIVGLEWRPEQHKNPLVYTECNSIPFSRFTSGTRAIILEDREPVNGEKGPKNSPCGSEARPVL
jgi:hypothetical protein